MQVQKLQLLQQAITEGLESGVSEFSIADSISERSLYHRKQVRLK
jgi:hypothetical protein